jgi:hypothetical protein
MKTTNKVPFEIVLSAGLFTTANGYVQGVSNQKITNLNQNNTFIMVVGAVLFFTGMYINIKSD